MPTLLRPARPSCVEIPRRPEHLGAICHGIQVLLAAGIGRGLERTCYKNVRFEVARCGGGWINQHSVVGGHIITSQTWESHAEFLPDSFQALEGWSGRLYSDQYRTVTTPSFLSSEWLIDTNHYRPISVANAAASENSSSNEAHAPRNTLNSSFIATP